MARQTRSSIGHHGALDRLPDRLLVDVGLDPQTVRRGGWAAHLRQLVRHMGPTRS
ncbi:MAG TPA: hypothetical protein VHA07_07440 [Devosia sp.]|nr:hypothetical protein [Devosia sp.]